jgi:hypothetical protein
MVARTVPLKLKRSRARCIEHGKFPVLREDLLLLSKVNGKCRTQKWETHILHTTIETFMINRLRCAS